MGQDVGRKQARKYEGWHFVASDDDERRYRDGEIERVPVNICGHDFIFPDVEEIVIPSSFIVNDVSYEVTSLCPTQPLFLSNLPMLRRLELPDGVTKIGGVVPSMMSYRGILARMLCKLPRLKEVVLPGRLKSIGSELVDVLCDCPSLAFVSIPASLVEIGYSFLRRCGALDLRVDDLERFIDVLYVYEEGGRARLPSEEYFEPTVADWLATLHPDTCVCDRDGKGWGELRFESMPWVDWDSIAFLSRGYFQTMHRLKHIETHNRVISRWVRAADTLRIVVGADTDGTSIVDDLGRFVNCEEIEFVP